MIGFRKKNTVKTNSFAQRLKSFFSSHSEKDENFFDDLTDLLVEGDVGAKTAVLFVEELKSVCKQNHIADEKIIIEKLRSMMLDSILSMQIPVEMSKTNVWMILGVNGVGKTTSVAKIAELNKKKGTIVMAAADTFRAAAIDQLEIHGNKLGIRVVKHQMGSDPSSVVYDACSAVRSSGGGLVLADTAGRLHNKENLVHELQKIDRICRTQSDEECYKKLLVIDATTGQNAFRQAEVFNDAVGLDGIVMTKYDSSAKGGVIISIGKELHIPVVYVCTGEHYEDISDFNKEKYIHEFLGQ